MTEILDKTKEWSDRFGGVLRASARTQYPHLYKGAVGGIEHVISVDNGAYYMEMWRDGSETYYATTGAAIKPLPGLAKGARLDEALDRFFTLMAKVEKDKEAMKRRLNMHDKRPAKKAIPKKAKRLLGLRNPKAETGKHSGSIWSPPGARTRPGIAAKSKPMRKRVVAKVDPEIGPSHSVGHKKPSGLSPESGVSKLARGMITHILGEPYNAMQKGNFAGPQPVSLARKTKKNVVALTAPGGVGNAPGSGRVKPGTGVKVTDPMKPAKPGTPPRTYRSPQGFSGRRMGAPGTPGAPAGTSGAGIKQARGLGQKTSQRRAPYVGGRPGGQSPLLRQRKIDDITGGRVGAGGKITPAKPAMGGPGQPVGYGSTGNPQYSYGRKAHRKQGYMRKNGCECAPTEVAKALRAIQ